MHVDIIERYDEMLPLRSEWDRIYASDPEGHFFLTWSWIANWLRDLGFRWVVLAARSAPDGRYLAFLPLQLRAEIDGRTGCYNSIRMGGSYFSVYTGALCEPEGEADALRAFATCIKSLNWRDLRLDDLYMSDRRRKMFCDEFEQDSFAVSKIVRGRHVTASGENIDHDIYMHVDELPDDWEDFLSTRIGSRTRRDIRNFLRKVDAEDDFRITLADAATVARDLDTFMTFWQTQWEARNPGYARGLLRNCRRMLPHCFQENLLFVPVLWRGDTPIGAHIAFIDRPKRTLLCFLVGRDVTVSKPSPGLVLHAFSIRWAIRNGFTKYDLGTGDFSYKYSLGTREHLIEGVRVSTKSGVNLGGRLEPRTIDDHLSRIRRLLNDNKLQLAEKACRQVLASDASKIEASQLLDIIASATPHVERLMAEAIDLHRSGQLRDAAKIYAAILAKDRQHFRANYMLGRAFLQSGRFEPAITHFGRAIATNPGHPGAHRSLGNALRSAGRCEEALAAYTKAVALKSDVPEVYNNIGLILESLGRPSEAVKNFDRALDINPEFSQASQNRERVLSSISCPSI